MLSATEKKELLMKLINSNPELVGKYKDENSGIEFVFEFPKNLSENIKIIREGEQKKSEYRKFTVDGVTYNIEEEVFAMIWQCYKFTKSPQFDIEDWIFLSIENGQFIADYSNYITMCFTNKEIMKIGDDRNFT